MKGAVPAFAAVLLFFVLSTPAFAQSSNASLGGTVSDTTGALIPGVTITATNIGTGIVSTVLTNESGAYQFASLQTGTYRISAELNGFRTQTYNDVALGYFAYRNPDPGAWLSAIVPTFEVHLSDPLSHRGAFRPNDPAGTPDVLDLTFGSSFILRQRLVASLGCAFPVTGPHPFDVEALALLNFYFGRSGMAPPFPLPPAGR